MLDTNIPVKHNHAMLSKDDIDVLRRSRPKGRNRLPKAMELAKLTQVQLAEQTGLTQSYISRLKNGQYSDIPGSTMRLLADVFGVTIEELFPAREAVAS